MSNQPLAHFQKKFVLHEKIGEGKFGQVFRVVEKHVKSSCGGDEQPTDGGKVRGNNSASATSYAAKFMKCLQDKERRHMTNEINILQMLAGHDHILQLMKVYEDHDNFVLVLEYLGGGQLFERIIQVEEDISERTIARLIRQICDALDYMSKFRIVHLDLKPENIVCVQKEGFYIKLVDFGFAQRLHRDEEQELIVTVGTPEFVSPEVIKRDPINLWTDMWSVGVLTYVLVSGLSPFLGDSPNETYQNIVRCNYTFDEEEFEDVSDECKDLIRRLLIVTPPRKRFSAKQCLEESEWLAGSAHRKRSQRTSVQPQLKFGGRKVSRLEKFVPRKQWNRWSNALKVVTSFKEGLVNT